MTCGTEVGELGTAAATFAPLPVSVRDARRFLRGFLAAHAVDGDLADSAELALSEVVTNAVLHAHTDVAVALTLTSGTGSGPALRVEVRDGSPRLPVQRPSAGQATTGRGMDLVAAYARACGVDAEPPHGKSVWFVVDGAGREEPSVEDLLDAWDVDLGDAGATPEAGQAEVVLLGLPPTLWLAAREHHDAVLRELVLQAAEHPSPATVPERTALADTARGLVSTHLLAALARAGAAQAHRALPPGHPSPLPDTPAALDLHLPVLDGAAEAFAALQDVLDVAEDLAVRGLLLARPGLPEVIAVRDWACEQAISQLAGVRPSPWPGTGQERFTSEVHDRLEPDVPQWDVRLVADSDRGAVAADDANRIIAVSRPLAEALGWEVEDLVGRRVVVLIPPELREAHVAGFTRHLTTGEAHAVGVPLVLPVLRADGERVSCSFLIEHTPLTSGRAVYVAWIAPV